MKITAPFFALGVWIASVTIGTDDPPAAPTPAGPAPAPTRARETPAESPGRAVVDPVLPPDPKEAEADRIAAEAVAETPTAASLSSEEKISILKDALGANADEALAYQALDEDVAQLRETLEAMIGKGEDTQRTLEGVPGFDDDLERIGIAREIADEIRELYPQVQTLRGKLLLLDAQTGTSGADFKPIEAVSPELVELPSSVPAVSLPTKLEPRPRTVLPMLEAELCFHAGDVEGALAILQKTPAGELGARGIYVLGSCLVAKRRFAEAKKVLAPLLEDPASSTLREAASRQMSRMKLIEAGLVGLDPLVIAVEENKR